MNITLRIFFLGTLSVLFVAVLIFSCPITFINDTDNSVFAFDDGFNVGDVIPVGDQRTYGAKGRHPMVCIFTQNGSSSAEAPADRLGSFKKTYRVNQKKCAASDADKIVNISTIGKDVLNKEIYDEIDLLENPELPPCCMHHDEEQAAQQLDEPLSALDEE